MAEISKEIEQAAKEAEAYFADHPEAAASGSRQESDTITIKFAKGLVGEPFMSKSGKELVEITIPNSDPGDKRPWQTFVLAARDVHENKFGKGMWAKIPAEGRTTVQRQTRTNPEATGPSAWTTEKTVVTNAELKQMVEFYKERPRESVKEKLDQHKEDRAEQKPPSEKTANKSKKDRKAEPEH